MLHPPRLAAGALTRIVFQATNERRGALTLRCADCLTPAAPGGYRRAGRGAWLVLALGALVAWRPLRGVRCAAGPPLRPAGAVRPNGRVQPWLPFPGVALHGWTQGALRAAHSCRKTAFSSGMLHPPRRPVAFYTGAHVHAYLPASPVAHRGRAVPVGMYSGGRGTSARGFTTPAFSGASPTVTEGAGAL